MTAFYALDEIWGKHSPRRRADAELKVVSVEWVTQLQVADCLIKSGTANLRRDTRLPSPPRSQLRKGKYREGRFSRRGN